ncbi:AraC family transcriptional regulator [Halomonas aquamarina]|uniref:AraC family transcriptional regulator n=1 Tax=Vreelandella aquamarina TaxID=77097 RepID=A0ACC5VUR2_9GAMM|nr:helix-turn-helix domain-containing protein [Halomonas aquamarina]MBZ5487618.1 AraC family transcriptional regulator [Halomonas aquamarina]
MPTLTSLTPATLSQLGHRFGIDYLHLEAAPDAPIAQGSVSDLPLPPALHLTLSDLEVCHSYHSRSTQSVPWFVCVVMEGRIGITQGQKRLTISAGQGLCSHFTPQAPLVVEQPVQRRLRTLNIAVLSTAPYTLPIANAPQLRAWTLPPALFTQLLALSEHPLDDWRQSLLWHGLALQLLGYGLPTPPPDKPMLVSDSRTRERERLAQLHDTLSRHPLADYSLKALARSAAMSPSSLRQKFRHQYGCTIFDHLRRCRLQKAYQQLEQGHSVQRVAHACGYSHATNFATAFKRQFGMAPTAVLSRTNE